MQGMRFSYSVHLHGELAANARGEFKLPCAASLVAVSTNNSAASDAILDVGPSGNRDGILEDLAIANENATSLTEPTSFNGADVDGVSPYHFAKGEILAWDLDFDGDGGTAAANVTLVFTFTEG